MADLKALWADLRKLWTTAMHGTGGARCAAWSGIFLFLSLGVSIYDPSRGVHCMLLALWFMGAGEIIDRG